MSADKLIALEDLKFLKSIVKNSKLQVVENAGHFPYIENPNKFKEIITTL